VAAIALIGVLAAGCGGQPASAGSGSTPTPAGLPPTTSSSAPSVSSKGPCGYTTTPSSPAPAGKTVALPPDPAATPKTGTVTVDFKTSSGDIPLTLDRAQAPCTVQSMVYLVDQKFFDNTPCHRETNYPNPNPLYVLQCGDPTGNGSGGPGYTIPDEMPKNLKLAPTPPPSGQPTPSIYPAGTLAMANSGQPHTGGSQFFLVYKDSQLPPNYTVLGTAAPAGMNTLSTIAAAGIAPGTDPSSGAATPNDGKPKTPVTITQATATA
jgi:peptidyl-prolyl cis-trans isomerase B (cyclophilin B)